jgi:hypothetical protein
MDAIELTVRRAQTSRPELRDALETVADALWPGEGVELAHQAAVQSFLWWEVPRHHDPGDWDALTEAAALLLAQVGNERLANIARSDVTAGVLEAWSEDPAAGAAACRAAQVASGVEPPDTDILAWSTVMGPAETIALEEVERALSDAVARNELVPGASRARTTAIAITERVLTTSLDLPPGQTFTGLVTTERISHWIALAKHPELQQWRSSVADRLLNPITADDPAPVVAPVHWLLELTAPPDGAELTQSGYLPRASVVEAAERFGWWEWEKPPRSEADVHQLTAIREAARRLGLIRRRRRRLLVTSRGSQLLERPAELWAAVATETEEAGEFALAVTEVVGLRLLTDRVEPQQLTAEVHPVLAALGWSSGGQSITLDQAASAIWIPIRWWSIFCLLDEEQPRWDPESHRQLNPHTFALNRDGQSMVLAFLRARAIRPRHSVHD